MAEIYMKATLELIVDEEPSELGSTSVKLTGLDVSNKLTPAFLNETLAQFQEILGIGEK